jgi:hypothetical protein
MVLLVSNLHDIMPSTTFLDMSSIAKYGSTAILTSIISCYSLSSDTLHIPERHPLKALALKAIHLTQNYHSDQPKYLPIPQSS